MTDVPKTYNPPFFSSNITPTRIEQLTNDIKSKYTAALQKIEQSQLDSCVEQKRPWDQTFSALSFALGQASEASAVVTLPAMTHGDSAVRAASTKAKDGLKKMFDDTFSRKGLYDILSKAMKSIEVDDDEKMSESDKRAASYLFKEFLRKGCALPNANDRDELVKKRDEIEKLCSDFASALNEDKTVLIFTEEELEGVDFSQFPLVDNETLGEGEASGKSAEPRSRRRKVSLKAPDTLPVLKYAKNYATRRVLAEAMAKKCQEINTERFLKTIRLRHECATMLGYDSHAQYMLEVKMVETPQRAEEFLRNLIDRSREQLMKDLETLKELKVREEGVDAGPLQPWDVAYYIRTYKESLGIDETKLRSYFPLDHVKKEILSIYQELLGLTFIKLETEVWHPEVECYAVTETGKECGEPLGFFYFDLFPRDGKYSHQCVYPLRPSYKRSDDTLSKPACANIGNLSRGSDAKPAMLWFREVETFFHEFGHVMHCVLSKSKHSVQAWAWSAVPWPGGVEQDFLEVPSMMLENFVWQPEILRRLSRRLEDGASLPDADIEALSKSRNVMEAYSLSRIVAMSLYDLMVHGGPGPYSYKGKELDAVALYDLLISDICGVPTIPGTFSVANWYHPMMGYDAGYYSYYWSEAYAADLFHEFEKSNSVVNRSLGSLYTEKILSPCAMLDGNTMLRNFLGRDPSLDPFLNRIFPK